MKNLICLLYLLPLLASGQTAEPESPRPFLAAVQQAMAAEIRSDAERERDGNRLPLETLDFFGLNENMRVLELVPGGGWYTKLLAPALYDNGQLYTAIGSGLQRSGLLEQPGFDKVIQLEPELEIISAPDQRLLGLAPFEFGVSDLDAVLTFRNLHNFNADGRASLNAAAFDALKPGGIYGVVDHTRRHMQPDDVENVRRVDPVQTIMEIQAAGFEFVDFTDLHYRPDDELRYEVGRKTVTGNTDRFTFLFRKPL
jgi:predicted methyltransferase